MLLVPQRGDKQKWGSLCKIRWFGEARAQRARCARDLYTYIRPSASRNAPIVTLGARAPNSRDAPIVTLGARAPNSLGRGFRPSSVPAPPRGADETRGGIAEKEKGAERLGNESGISFLCYWFRREAISKSGEAFAKSAGLGRRARSARAARAIYILIYGLRPPATRQSSRLAHAPRTPATPPAPLESCTPSAPRILLSAPGIRTRTQPQGFFRGCFQRRRPPRGLGSKRARNPKAFLVCVFGRPPRGLGTKRARNSKAFFRW